ncbi:hypothetical protein BC643_1184 [Mangrovibacterium diazotrophicum]|uniref:Uncharacterized protein n=1 Tax=Mangrovibacterium diazotrophicum TaxID=1261403 RepID=A0A419W5Z6_9BACT|nr:hypothetical protein BC643_1184 [Mangrovibacterium diazotrophicum]
MLRLDSFNSYIFVLPRQGLILRLEYFGPFKCWDVYSLRHRQILYTKKIKSPE